MRNSALLGLAAAPLAWYFLHDYQRQRILTLFDPEQDPLGSGYHIIQSTIAVGSGGAFGKGWLNGTQSHLEFIPERATDFIFAVYCEEFGFTGVPGVARRLWIDPRQGFAHRARGAGYVRPSGRRESDVDTIYLCLR